MNLNLKQKLFGSKLKKIVWSVVLFTAILCATFIRIVPDFSTSRGFAVVSLSDYNKYKQGYYLKENRILPREELYKRAVRSYFINLYEYLRVERRYNIFEDKYIYDDYCMKSDKRCQFWASDRRIGIYELSDFIDVNKTWEQNLKNLGFYILDIFKDALVGKDNKLKYTILYDIGGIEIQLFTFNSIDIIHIDEVKKIRNLKLVGQRNKEQNLFPDTGYSKFYLKINVLESAKGINQDLKADIPFGIYDLIKYYYYPISNCGYVDKISTEKYAEDYTLTNFLIRETE